MKRIVYCWKRVTPRFTRRARRVLLALSVVVACMMLALYALYESACAAIQANYATIEEGMFREEVVAILGPPVSDNVHPNSHSGMLYWCYGSKRRPSVIIMVYFNDWGATGRDPTRPHMAGRPSASYKKHYREPWIDALWRRTRL